MPKKQRPQTNTSGSKKKKVKSHQSTLCFGDGSKGKELEALNALHQGKRLLFGAKSCYKCENDIPESEKNLLFVYKFLHVNPDGEQATLDFESKCIKEGGDEWINYADTVALFDDLDLQLKNYPLSKLKEDHERYNYYLGNVNRILNDKREEAEKQLQEDTRIEQDDVDAIISKYTETSEDVKDRCYTILLGEFEPIGELQDHVIKGKSKYCGKESKKQDWQHIFSRKKFTWHYKHGQNYFDNSTLWRQCKEIVARNYPGSIRLAKIMELSDKGGIGLRVKVTRDEDMINRVCAVKAALGTKSPLSIFDDEFF